MKSFFYTVFLTLSLCLFGQVLPELSDELASRKAKNLYAFLASLSTDQTLFGHQDDVLYGLEWQYNLNSDVELVSGKRPSIVGWDIGGLGIPAVAPVGSL